MVFPRSLCSSAEWRSNTLKADFKMKTLLPGKVDIRPGRTEMALGAWPSQDKAAAS